MIDIFKYQPPTSSRQLYFELGRSLAQKGEGKLEQCIQYLNLALAEETKKERPADIEIYIFLGNLHLKHSNEGEAIMAFLNAVASSSEYSREILHAVQDYLTRENIIQIKEWVLETWKPKIEELETLSETAALGLNYFWARFNLYCDNFKDAISFYEKVLEKDNDDYRALEGLGEAYLELRVFAKAEQFLKKAKKLAPKESDRIDNISYKIISAQLSEGAYKEALDELENLVHISDDEKAILFLRTKALGGLGRYKEGNKILDDLLQSESENIEFLIAKIENHIALHDYQNSLSLIKKTFQIDALNDDLLFLKIQCLIEGQIDLEEGKRLFWGEDYGYFFVSGEKQVLDKINKILESRPKDGNAFFFAAFLTFLFDPDSESIKDWLEKASTYGLENINQYPFIGLSLLKGRIAEREENFEEAGNHLFQAGRWFYWQSENSRANRYFKEVIDHLHPPSKKLNASHKYYADTLIVLSYFSPPRPPYYDQEKIEEAYNTWHDSPEQVVIDKDEAWHYIVIGRIHEIRFKFKKTNFNEEYWSAILYAERGLIHNRENNIIWTYLGRFFRDFGLEFNALEAFKKSESLVPNQFVQEEKTMLLLNMGRYEEAEIYLEKLSKNEKVGPSYCGWEGYLEYHLNKDYQKALTLFDELSQSEYTSMFANSMKMFCYWSLKDFESAKKAAIWIQKLRDEYTYLKEEYTFAWCHFILDDPSSAISVLEETNKDANQPDGHAYSLIQFFWYIGDIDNAQSKFEYFIKWAFNKRVLNELIKSLFVLEALVEYRNSSLHPKAKEILNHPEWGWKKRIKDRISYLDSNSPSPEKEIKYCQMQFLLEKGTLPHITTQVILARLAREQGDLHEAHHAYLSLNEHHKHFPEVKLAIEQTKAEIFERARSQIESSNFQKVVEDLLAINKVLSINTTRINTLLSIAFFGINNEQKATDHLVVALDGGSESSSLREQILEEFSCILSNNQLAWEFGYFLQNKISSVNGDICEDYWNELINQNQSKLHYPTVTPISVEISNDLIPPEAESDDWVVIQEKMPRMRERFMEEYNVYIPGVKIRGNEWGLAYGTYQIILDESPVVSGSINKDKLFVHETLEVLELLNIDAEEAFNPYTQKESSWVDIKFKDRLIAYDVHFWEDPFEYIIAHLQGVISQNLDFFIDSQSCYDYLQDNYKEEDDLQKETKKIANTISSNSDLIIKFKQVLKKLVKEKVPIVEKDIIIKSFIENGKQYAEVDKMVQYLRIQMKGKLPGNNPKLVRVPVPKQLVEDLERDLKTQDGKTFLAVKPENCQEMLLQVRSLISTYPNNKDFVLLIDDTKLRIHLRRLVELEFPNLMVISKEELIDF